MFYHLKPSRPIDGCWRQSTECVCFANHPSRPRHVLTGRQAGVWSNNLIIARHPTVMCVRAGGLVGGRDGGWEEGFGGRKVVGVVSLENSGRTCKIVRRAIARHTRLYIRY